MPNFVPTHDRFLFASIAGRRATQLQRGAVPRVTRTAARPPLARTAQEEVLRGLVPFRVPGRTEADTEGIRLAGKDSQLIPSLVLARGGASVVVTDPDGVMTLHAASLSATMSSLYRSLLQESREFLNWTVWTTQAGGFVESEHGDVFEARADDGLPLLRTALSLMHSAWVAEEDHRGALVMTLTIRDESSEEIAIEAPEPVLMAYPGSLSLQLAGKLIKPVSWAVTFSLRGGISRSVTARSIRDRLRKRALKKGNVEILPEPSDVTPDDVAKTRGLVIFIHGLMATDIGTFDALIDRVRFLARDALLVGFSHDTLASITANAQELTKWLLDVVGFRHRSGRIEKELPIVFVCHSRGGLVGRAVAAQLFGVHEIWSQLLRGVVTFGTPHKGAALAEFPEQMAAVVAMLLVRKGTGSAMGIVDVLAYTRNGGTFEGIQNLQAPEGAKDSSTNFLIGLQDQEIKVGPAPLLAFGGSAAPDFVVTRLVGRALNTIDHDYVVERRSSTPSKLSGVGTDCNHFGYFAPTAGNKPHLDRAARQIAEWLR